MPIEEVRDSLRETTSYLADADVVDDLQWFRTNSNFERVVTKADAIQYHADIAAYTRDPTCLPHAPETPPPATLSAIVRLKKQEFRLIPCGDWAPGPHRGEFSKVRPGAVAEDPNIPAIDGDYEAAWAGLKRLVEKKFEPVGNPDEMKVSGGIIDFTGASAPPHYSHGFRISHRVFELKSKYAESATANAPAVGSQDVNGGDDEPMREMVEFNIEDWPVRREAAKQELDKLKDTHVVIPIPAYDLAGELIQPAEYEAKLRGAIVRLEFHVNHWRIQGKHYFTGDIKKIRVLATPQRPAEPDTPTVKRKRVAKFDSFSVLDRPPQRDDDDDYRDGSPVAGPSRHRRRLS